MKQKMSKNYDDGLVVLAEKLRKTTNSDHLILTLGKDGVVIQTKNNKKISNNLSKRKNIEFNKRGQRYSWGRRCFARFFLFSFSFKKI